MSNLNDLYSVSNNSGKPLVLDFAGHGQGSGVPVFSGNAGTPFQIVAGANNFIGNGTKLVQSAVPHAIGTFPWFVTIFPALTNTGSGWGAETYQYQAADPGYMYVAAYTPDGQFGSGFVYYFNWLVIAPLP